MDRYRFTDGRVEPVAPLPRQGETTHVHIHLPGEMRLEAPAWAIAAACIQLWWCLWTD